MVYRAEDLKLGRSVALKFLPEELASDVKARERFEREARAASALDHPAICAVYEFGEHEGQPFLAMPLLLGQTLRDRIAADPALQMGQWLGLAVQIAEGLQAAHHHGIIHRDIKPANIFITHRGESKILDFGLARLDGTESVTSPKRIDWAADPSLTATGAEMGTAAYMSPEQVRGEKLDTRTDLFSFGLVLYELATQKQAFAGDTREMLHDAILNRTPAPLSQFNPDVLPQLESIINKALQKDRGLRYQTASELRADLLRLKHSTDVSRSSTRRWPTLMVVAAVFLVAAAIAWFPGRKTSFPANLIERQLTANSTDNPVEGGAISPDGKYLAYIDPKGMHIKLLETGEMHTVPEPEALKDTRVDWDVRPWSRTRFVATAFVAGQPDSAWMVSVMGGAPQKLRDDAYPQFVSSNGSLIVFKTLKGKVGYREIWLMDSSGERARRLEQADEDSGFRYISLSPDGQRLGYIKEHRAADRIEVTLETRGLNGGSPSTVLSGVPLWLYTWMPDGRIIYVLSKQDINGQACDCWETRLDPRTGKPIGTPVRLTNWAGFCVGPLTSTADGKRLVFNKWSVQRSVYIADLASGKPHSTTPRRLTLSDGQEYPAAWTSDSNTIVFVSNRLGTWGIFKQSPGEEEAQALVTGLPNRVEAGISPDGHWILYQSFSSLTSGRLTRIPLAGGEPQPVLTLLTAPEESPWMGARAHEPPRCSRSPATLCAIAERTADGQHLIFTAFDPIKGRGSELTRFRIDPAAAYKWDLSPDGTRLAILQRADHGIQILPLNGDAPYRIAVRGWRSLETLDWDAHGTGLFTSGATQGNSVLLYIDLKGNSFTLWKQPGEQEGGTDVYAIPSPDSRHLAVYGWTSNSNMWMMEKF